MLSSASEKSNLLAENFSENSNLDDFLPTFTSQTILKLYSISTTPKLVKKVITILHSPKTLCPDCISMAVLKNYEFELSYILADLFNVFLKEPLFFRLLESFICDTLINNIRERLLA